MHKSLLAGCALALTALSTPAFAQDEASSDITISGGAEVVSDYRFRGFSQSNEEFAIQGTLSAAHSSGVYVGTWGSSIAFGGGTEIDVYGGYKTEIAPGITADIGATYYIYPNASTAAPANVIEGYASLSGALGPVTAKVGAAYAPSGQGALGDDSALYLSTDLSAALPGTPVTLLGHVGYANSDSFLGGTDGDVMDYMVGASASYSNLTFSAKFISTDVNTLAREALGADNTVAFSVGAYF
jgi:uncharacterized protein (TIGR02001 family)